VLTLKVVRFIRSHGSRGSRLELGGRDAQPNRVRQAITSSEARAVLCMYPPDDPEMGGQRGLIVPVSPGRPSSPFEGGSLHRPEVGPRCLGAGHHCVLLTLRTREFCRNSRTSSSLAWKRARCTCVRLGVASASCSCWAAMGRSPPAIWYSPM